ncbi:hypothetical protein D3C76_1763980 [compost metagenome]
MACLKVYSGYALEKATFVVEAYTADGCPPPPAASFEELLHAASPVASAIVKIAVLTFLTVFLVIFVSP